MTREQVKKFITESMGIAEPTDEQVTAFLNSLNSEVKKAENKANLYKEEAEKAKELQAKLDEIANRDLTEIEKANKETEKANKMIADLESKVKAMERTNALAKIGIVGDDATNLIGEDGAINFDLLGTIISARETSAVDTFKAESLKRTPNPLSGKGNDDENKVNEVTQSVIDSMKSASATNQTGLDAYK